MRLIDADRMKQNIIDAGGHETANELREWVENQATIDAIPVEWLDQRRFETSFNGAEPDLDLNYAFCTVMNEWQKEQEDRS